MHTHAVYLLYLVAVCLLFLRTALAQTDDWDWEQEIRPSRWSLLIDQPDGQWHIRDKNEIVRIEKEFQTRKQEQVDEFLKTLLEPTAGTSFEGKSFASIAASVATCGTAVTFQIKNYLKKPILGLHKLKSGELVGQALGEIQAKTKEIVVVKDESNSPQVHLKYSVGNTTVEFHMHFSMQANQINMTLVTGNSSPKHPSASTTSETILPIDFTKVDEKFQLTVYQNHYTQELVQNYRKFYIRMTSRLALPRRLAITAEIFRTHKKILKSG